MFNNPKYPLITLVRDTPAQGNLPNDGLKVYEYVAGPNAQNTVFSPGNMQLWIYESDQQTFVDRMSPSKIQSVTLTPNQTYYIAAAHGPLDSGDYSILVTEEIP